MNNNGNQQYPGSEESVVRFQEAPAQEGFAPQPAKETPMQYIQGQQPPVQFYQGQQPAVQFVPAQQGTMQQYVQGPDQEKCAPPVACKHPGAHFARRLLLKFLLGLVILVLILYLYLLFTA